MALFEDSSTSDEWIEEEAQYMDDAVSIESEFIF